MIKEALCYHHKTIIAIALVGAVLILGGVSQLRQVKESLARSFSRSANPLGMQYSPSATPSPPGITVDVSGGVKKPGVYVLPAGSRVEQAIKIAGGISDKVDQKYLSKSINLSQKITDGAKLYIPLAGEQVSVVTSQPTGSQGTSETGSNKIVNINTASVAELDQLPGIGPTTAQKIIDKRPYQQVSDLASKKAVSATVYQKIKALVSTDG